VLATLAFAAACVAAFLIFDPTGKDDKAAAPAAAAPLRVAALVGAKDFDPSGGNGEHTGEVRNVFDRDTTTTWSTETYASGELGKDGVGIYVWAARPVAAKRLEVVTATSGFTARVYGANSIPTDLAGWGQPIGRLKGSGSRMRASLTGGHSYARYLVWITKLPPQHTSVDIATIRVQY
jgi:hypothetical protein